jgi:hypothetical protein
VNPRLKNVRAFQPEPVTSIYSPHSALNQNVNTPTNMRNNAMSNPESGGFSGFGGSFGMGNSENGRRRTGFENSKKCPSTKV